MARFLSVDPLAADFPAWSPYNFVLGNPIKLIDPDGRAPGEPEKTKKSSPAKITTGYYGVNRSQIGGNTTVNLNTDFQYITPSSGSRFAPDEPSSFAHINYNFADNNKNTDFSIGLFRNHTKGDFLFGGDNDVHWSVGNSQIGLGVGFEATTPSFKGFTASASVFAGVGPQFSKFTSDFGQNVSPDNWGVRGFGEVATFGLNVSSPKLGGIFSVSLSAKATFHHASFSDFSVTNPSTGNTTTHSGVNFSTGGITPTIQLNFDLRKTEQ